MATVKGWNDNGGGDEFRTGLVIPLERDLALLQSSFSGSKLRSIFVQ